MRGPLQDNRSLSSIAPLDTFVAGIRKRVALDFGISEGANFRRGQHSLKVGVVWRDFVLLPQDKRDRYEHNEQGTVCASCPEDERA